MQNNFELVKQQLPIGTLAAHYHSTVKNKFLEPCPCCNHKGCCSFDEVKGVFKCFSCDASGSVIDLIMAVDNCTDAEAVRRGAEIAGVELKESKKTERKVQETEKARMYRLTAAFYEKNMAEPGCKGKEWFCGTRGHKEAVLKKMRVGWAPKKGGLIPYLDKQGFKAETIVKFGLASDTDRNKKPCDPFDYYRGMAVFPIIDHDGTVIAFTAKDPEKKNMKSFMRGLKGVWFINYAALGRYDELFIVEGENDVASIMDAGFPNVVGTAGGPTLEQIKLIRNFCSGATIFTWFDKDDRDPRDKRGGGIQYTRKLIEGLKDDNIDVKIIVHPGACKDADEYLQGGYGA